MSRSLEQKVDLLVSRFDEMHSTIAGLSEHVTALHIPIQDMQVRIGNLESDMHEVKDRLISLDYRVAASALRIESIDESLKDLESAEARDAIRIFKLHKRVTRLEEIVIQA